MHWAGLAESPTLHSNKNTFQSRRPILEIKINYFKLHFYLCELRILLQFPLCSTIVFKGLRKQLNNSLSDSIIAIILKFSLN